MYCSSHGSCGYYMEYCSRTLIYSSTSFNHQLALQSSLAGHHFSSTKYRCSWTNKYLLSASEKNPSSVLDLFQLMCGLAMDGLSKPSVFKSADHVDIQNKIAHVRLFNTSTKKSVGTFSESSLLSVRITSLGGSPPPPPPPPFLFPSLLLSSSIFSSSPPAPPPPPPLLLRYFSPSSPT